MDCTWFSDIEKYKETDWLTDDLLLMKTAINYFFVILVNWYYARYPHGYFADGIVI